MTFWESFQYKFWKGIFNVANLLVKGLFSVEDFAMIRMFRISRRFRERIAETSGEPN